MERREPAFRSIRLPIARSGRVRALSTALSTLSACPVVVQLSRAKHIQALSDASRPSELVNLLAQFFRAWKFYRVDVVDQAGWIRERIVAYLPFRPCRVVMPCSGFFNGAVGLNPSMQ